VTYVVDAPTKVRKKKANATIDGARTDDRVTVR
jgi:hypothetical protein